MKRFGLLSLIPLIHLFAAKNDALIGKMEYFAQQQIEIRTCRFEYGVCKAHEHKD